MCAYTQNSVPILPLPAKYDKSLDWDADVGAASVWEDLVSGVSEIADAA